MADIKTLENKVFSVNVKGTSIPVEFKLELISNDMKMLAFLAGELSNSAYYFTTFADVNQGDCNDVNKTFNLDRKSEWKPFLYKKRLNDAKKVKDRKALLAKGKSNVSSQHAKVLNFISKELKSRQEETPLFENYIDYARCEPLHLKNNVMKELFMKVFKHCIVAS